MMGNQVKSLSSRRATLVVTNDNISIIVPNSQFISNQVTNWSFKDKRVRRNIYVGVAYGSDVALVRDTLLEVSNSTRSELKRVLEHALWAESEELGAGSRLVDLVSS